MKTTQKSLLLLSLCTLFGFLVYVDFMGGVRGGGRETINQGVSVIQANTIEHLIKDNHRLLLKIEGEVSESNRAYAHMVLNQAKYISGTLRIIADSIAQRKVKKDRVENLANSAIEVVMQTDTLYKWLHRIHLNYKEYNDIELYKTYEKHLRRMENKALEISLSRLMGAEMTKIGLRDESTELIRLYQKLDLSELVRTPSR